MFTVVVHTLVAEVHCVCGCDGSTVAVITVSATPSSSRIVSVMVAPVGTFVVLTTTGTGELVLIVMSGKLFGFGVTGVPFMLMTCAEAGPAVGSRSG